MAEMINMESILRNLDAVNGAVARLQLRVNTASSRLQRTGSFSRASADVEEMEADAHSILSEIDAVKRKLKQIVQAAPDPEPVGSER